MKKSKPESYAMIYIGLLILAISITLTLFSANEWISGRFVKDDYGLILISLAVAILGPIVGISFLIAAYSSGFREKFFKIQENKPVIECKKCAYDLRGSVLAGVNECPECGSIVPNEQVKKIRLLDKKIKYKNNRK